MASEFVRVGAFAQEAFAKEAFFTGALWAIDPPPLGPDGGVDWTPLPVGDGIWVPVTPTLG